MVTLFDRYGLRLVERAAYGHVPQGIIRRSLPHSIGKMIDDIGLKRCPGWFGYEFLYVFRKRENVTGA